MTKVCAVQPVQHPPCIYVACSDGRVVYVEKNDISEQIQVGDSLQWDRLFVYWNSQRIARYQVPNIGAKQMSVKYSAIVSSITQPQAPRQTHVVTLTRGPNGNVHLACLTYPPDVVTEWPDNYEALRRYFYRQGCRLFGIQLLDETKTSQRIAQPKHYYNDLGIQDYEIPPQLFEQFKQVIATTRPLVPSTLIFRIMNCASEILLIPEPHPGMSVSRRWLALKAIYDDFIKNGYLANDFLLVAWHLAVKVSCKDDS